MATYAENLVIARDAYGAKLAAMAADDHKTTYSVDGQSYSWTEYQAFLLDAIEKLDAKIAQQPGNVWIGHSQAVT